MARRRRGRITVQHQPTGAARGMMRGMGVVHAIFGGVFTLIAITQIMPLNFLFSLPFLAGGLFFCINGIRMAVSKNGLAQRVAYDMETGIEEDIIAGLTQEPLPTVQDDGSFSAPRVLETNAKQRLEQLESLKSAGLITQREYDEKREEIISRL